MSTGVTLHRGKVRVIQEKIGGGSGRAIASVFYGRGGGILTETPRGFISVTERILHGILTAVKMMLLKNFKAH